MKQPHTSIKVAVFDLDGTLLNTLEHILQAFEKVTAKHGMPAGREKILAVVGPPLVDCYKALLPDHSPETAAETHHSYQQTDEFMELITEYAGLRNMLAALHAEGIKTAIFTNRWQRGVDLIFGKLDLENQFDVIITPESVKNGKPNPEGLYIISKQLDCATEEMAMIGDMVVDIEAGKNAGVGATIGITHGFGSPEQLKEAGADFVVDSLEEIITLVERLNHGKN